MRGPYRDPLESRRARYAELTAERHALELRAARARALLEWRARIGREIAFLRQRIDVHERPGWSGFGARSLLWLGGNSLTLVAVLLLIATAFPAVVQTFGQTVRHGDRCYFPEGKPECSFDSI
jgi:hypothetical protein